MKLGFAVPIFANPGVADFRTPNLETLDWPQILSAVREAEALGYDSAWVADHVFLGRDGAILEGWTTLAALAGATQRLRLGPIHLGNGFRPAPMVAKMVSTLDFISGGRCELFIDPGWRAREHVAYGFAWEPDRPTRVAQLAEALDVMRAMWTSPAATYHGRYYTVEGAICAPAERVPRIWIGEAFDEATLDLVVRYADVWNSMPASVATLREKIARVDQACLDRGRDPATLVKTLETQVLITADRAQEAALFDRFAELAHRYPTGDAMTDVLAYVGETNAALGGPTGPDQLRDEFVMGTVSEVTDKLAAYAELGVDEVIFWFMDFPDLTSLRLLATEVAPRLRGSR